MNSLREKCAAGELSDGTDPQARTTCLRNSIRKVVPIDRRKQRFKIARVKAREDVVFDDEVCNRVVADDAQQVLRVASRREDAVAAIPHDGRVIGGEPDKMPPTMLE